MGFNWSGYQWQKDMQARLNNAIKTAYTGNDPGKNSNGSTKSKKY